MALKIRRAQEPEFDVVIVGSGVAGALVADRLAAARHRVLILEAGGVPPDTLGRWAMMHSYVTSPAKSPDAPYCGYGILAPQPNPVDPKNTGYYDYDSGNKEPFKSYYERLVGGSTWHWQGIYLRMLPSDFRMKSHYNVGRDWPLTYEELEEWYVRAEYELGVAGNDKQNDEFLLPTFGAFRSRPFPMPELPPTYLDAQIGAAVQGAAFTDFIPGAPVPKNPDGSRGVRVRLTNVPHAINSQPFQGRPACDGHTSCVPLCPIRARYDATVHLDRALAAGAALRTQAVVTRLEFDREGRVSRVHYKRWDKSEGSATGHIVVLAANGIENPKILLLSNAKNDAIGRFLMDHPIRQSFALAPRAVYPFRGPQTTSDIEVFRDGAFRSTYAAFKTSIKNDGWSTNMTGAPRGNAVPAARGATDKNPGTLLDLVKNWNYFGTTLRTKLTDYVPRHITLNSACEQLPDKDNRVRLSSNLDALGIPRPLLSYRVDDAAGYVRKSFQQIVKFHAWVFTRMGIPSADQFLLSDDPALNYGGSGHIMGTTIMGSKRDSVVDKDCRAHDHSNLYILGSSVFPTGSTANPTSTLAALALRAARQIGDELRRNRREP